MKHIKKFEKVNESEFSYKNKISDGAPSNENNEIY